MLTILHVIICIAMILVILLQAGKGADMGAIFGGGGSQTLFGAAGGQTFMSKATTGLAAGFMIMCLVLALLSSRTASIMPEETPDTGSTIFPATGTEEPAAVEGSEAVPAEAAPAEAATAEAVAEENSVQETVPTVTETPAAAGEAATAPPADDAGEVKTGEETVN